jgi:heat shock protein HtpX
MWEQIRSNRIRSVVLVIGMGLLLLAVGWVIGLWLGSGPGGIIIALLVWGVLNLVAYFQGDSILLSVSKARKIGPDDAPKLYNVVEEMKIASGLPRMPDVYIIDDPAMNAFATGRDENHASVAITSGLLEKLNRDELQGVIGHEMSHIKNRDVLLMSMLSVMLGTIVILAWYVSRIMLFSGMSGQQTRRGSRDSGGGGAQVIIMVIGLVLMILAPIFAQLIYFAVSRRREYLADASSALYTRYPEGLASALEKLSNSTDEVKSANQATAPMYIVNPFRKKFSVNDWTSTHPPISERIHILRAMAGGASLAEYERAYSQMHKGSSIVPASALAGTGTVGLRAASPQSAEEPTKVDRVRETSDMLWRMNNYKMITCECGTKLKLPPEYTEPTIKCPHCGRINQT